MTNIVFHISNKTMLRNSKDCSLKDDQKTSLYLLMGYDSYRMSHQKPSWRIGFNSRATSIKNVFTLAILLAIHMKKRIGLQRTLVEKGANVSIY